MCFIHMPPPINVLTYSQYFDNLWTVSLTQYLDRVSCCMFVIDKPNCSPPPRILLHKKRSMGKIRVDDYNKIANFSNIPHSKVYTALLTNSEFKSRLIEYITDKLIERCKHVSTQTTVKFVIDSPSLQGVFTIKSGDSGSTCQGTK